MTLESPPNCLRHASYASTILRCGEPPSTPKWCERGFLIFAMEETSKQRPCAEDVEEVRGHHALLHGERAIADGERSRCGAPVRHARELAECAR